jgi:type III secretory pathway component EscS
MIRHTFYFVRPPAFPQLQYVAYVGIIFSIVQAATGNYPQALFALGISLIIVLSRSWTRLNIQSKRLIDFFVFIPYRNVGLDAIHRIIFTERVVSQTLNSRGSTSDIRYYQYKILLDAGQETIVLKEGRNQEKLRQIAMDIAAAAHVTMDDRST